MSRFKSLSSQTRKVNIVIRKNKEIPLSKIKEYCDIYFDRYAFIEHKCDKKPDTGEIEGCHYHIVGDYTTNKTPLSTRLNEIVKFFKFDNAHGIEIDGYRTFEGSLQYLTHKNQTEKTQHNRSDIIHNLSSNDFEILYNAEIGNVATFDLLYCAVTSCENILQVIEKLGIGTYRTYRLVILDMWKSYYQKDSTYSH